MIQYLDKLVSAEVQDFIFKNEHLDEQTLVLKHKEIFGVPSFIIANQISGRRKASGKFGFLYDKRGIIYPPKLNLEQSSSELTSGLKQKIISSLSISFNSAADLTGGWGVDSYFLSSLFKSFHYVEPDATLLQIARHNHTLLGCTNIIYHHCSAEEFLQSNIQFELIYLDPSRRDLNAKKIIKLNDCSPAMPSIEPMIYSKSKTYLLKAAPLLDIKYALTEITSIKSIHVVSVSNECKELLFVGEFGYRKDPHIYAINLNGENKVDSFEFTLKEEASCCVNYNEPQKFIYEPNASILKAGAFNTISERFGLAKLDVNTHLYTSNDLNKAFPGRIFKVIELTINEKTIEQLIPEKKVNIVTRNYPLKPDEIKKKYKLLDGGKNYLLGFTCAKHKYLSFCERL